MFGYEKLEVWQLAKKLAVQIYRITNEFPVRERYGFTSQLNRAVLSVASNIAEGNSRSSAKDKAHFTEMAYGSLMEVCCQLDIAKEVDFISEETWNNMRKDIKDLAQKLSALRSYQMTMNRGI